MNPEFIQGGYNVHEHNHTEWSIKRLEEELTIINELMLIPRRGEQRLAQLALRKSIAEQELNSRGFES